MRHSIMPTLLVAGGLVLTVPLALADDDTTTTTDNTAEHHEKANNALRIGAAWVVPNGDTTIHQNQVDQAHITADNATGFFIDWEGRIMPWLGIDVEGLYAKPKFHAFPVTGIETVESTKTYTGSVGINFHVFSRARVDLYLGPYLAYTFFGNVFNDAFGYGGLLGLDIGLTKKGLILTGSVRYTHTDADFKDVNGATYPYDPLVYQLGLGWRF
ncbi:MAG TPA: outer membrane beta-barrel protein [Candidatus Polarisedimenticolaceae bacterium]|nr:outer membrane beta-barrel protein [Candidatus Polarisedimenticolaceae bacterium]